MTPPTLTVQALGHTYPVGTGGNAVLDDVSFTVEPGEVVCIVGPSGCGKTTLLRALAGLLAPTRGQVLLHGRPVRDVPSGLAIVMQDYRRSLPAWHTAAESIDLVLDRSGTTRAARRDRVTQALHQVGLTNAAHKHPAELSGGMQQRIAIARALVTRPRLLLMDEPFASVDAQTRFDLEDLLLDVQTEHMMTAVVITHDLDEAVYLGDRVIVLSGNPCGVIEQLVPGLPGVRHQVDTRACQEFVRARSRIARLLLRQPDPDPAIH